jgi:excisionase family DNA binding protein
MHLFDGLGDRIWTLSEAAEALDYDEDHVREHAEAGHLPSFKIGDELMFSKGELESWILSLGRGNADDEAID